MTNPDLSPAALEQGFTRDEIVRRVAPLLKAEEYPGASGTIMGFGGRTDEISVRRAIEYARENKRLTEKLEGGK